MTDLGFLAVAGFVLSAVLSVAVLILFPRWGLVDRPHLYGHKRDPVPYPGGIAPVLTWLLIVGALLGSGHLSSASLALWVAVIPLVIVSFLDDRIGISPAVRLLIQAGCAAIVVYSGAMLDYVRIPGLDETLSLVAVLGPIIAGLLSVGWIVVATNVFNWLDGIAGLASQIAMVSGVFLAALSLTPDVNQPELAMLALPLAGAAAAFLLVNLSPPRALLGDTGSMFFGFALATFSIIFGGKVATAFLVMALPLADAIYVVVRRIIAGKNPLKGNDKRHLHDRLLQLGVPQRVVILGYTSISLLLGYAALQSTTTEKAILLTSVFIAFWCITLFCEYRISLLQRHAT